MFENSYCGSLEDKDKIYKLTNKLIRCTPIHSEALKLDRYTDWVRFRNKLLRLKGKKPEEVMQEFSRLRLGRDEDVIDYVDKLISHIT